MRHLLAEDNLEALSAPGEARKWLNGTAYATLTGSVSVSTLGDERLYVLRDELKGASSLVFIHI